MRVCLGSGRAPLHKPLGLRGRRWMDDDERDRIEGSRTVRGVLVAVLAGLILWSLVGLIVWLLTR